MACAGASEEAMAAMANEIQRRTTRKEEKASQDTPCERQDDLQATDWVAVRCGYG